MTEVVSTSQHRDAHPSPDTTFSYREWPVSSPPMRFADHLVWLASARQSS